MKSAKLQAFVELKYLVEKEYKRRHSNCTTPIEDWKGEEIKFFQADLQEKLGGYVSEKWFYTHIKNKANEKLPRVDMLNMLAVYAEFENWESYLDTFQLEHKEEGEDVVVEEKKVSQRKVIRLSREWIFGIASMGCLLLLTIAVASWQISWKKGAKYQLKICVVDADDEKKIGEVEAELLRPNETQLFFKADSMGCFQFEQESMRFKLVLRAPYYKTDTIERFLMDAQHQEMITLKKDDYALMLHYFSKEKMKDWKKRREQLDKMLADEVQVVQLLELEGEEMGIEMYNKEEFINKMTLPINSLKNIEIIKSEYQANKIVSLRFIQHED